MTKLKLRGLLALAISPFVAGISTGQTVDFRPTEVVNGRKAVANESLVQFRAAAAQKRGELTLADRSQSERISINDIQSSVDAEYVRPIGGAGWYLVHSRSIGSESLWKQMTGRSDIAAAEPNYMIKPATDSVAQYYAPYQWALKNTGQTISGPAGNSTGVANADIKASQAWSLTTGLRKTVIATIDPTGIDYTHPDLAPNIWSAPSSYTVVVGGVQYTCPAGSHGFQFVNNSQTQGPCDPRELFNQPHGTILAGIMGANGASSIGVAGINWTTSIIHINGATDADVINAIDFLIQTKNHFGAAANIRIINNSYLIPDASQAVLQEINVANTNGMLFVAAAGNGGNSNDSPGGTFPASFGAPPYNAPNVISVANTDNHDNLCEAQCPGVASAWGGQSVHLGAPGWAIASTMPNSAYNVSTLFLADVSTGTSASSPYVAGTAALVLSRCADLNTAQLKQEILGTVDYVPGLVGCINPNGSNYCTITRGTTSLGQPGGGRLNAFKAVSGCGAAVAVTKAGTGSGTVSSNISGTVAGALAPISCGSVCSAVFKSPTYGGASVTLTATPAAGSSFTGWSGACTGTSTCVISPAAAASVTASFGPTGYAINPSPNGLQPAGPFALNSLTESGKAVTATAAGGVLPLFNLLKTGFQAGDRIQITGSAVAGYNGTWIVTSVSASQVTFNVTASGLAASSSASMATTYASVGGHFCVPSGDVCTQVNFGTSVRIAGASLATYNGVWTFKGWPQPAGQVNAFYISAPTALFITTASGGGTVSPAN